MLYVKLGSTGLDISPVMIGAMTYGAPNRGHPAWSLGRTRAVVIRYPLEHGINFFDTANVYSRVLQRGDPGPCTDRFRRPRRYRHCPEGAPPDAVGANGKGLSQKAIMTELDHSLRRAADGLDSRQTDPPACGRIAPIRQSSKSVG